MTDEARRLEYHTLTAASPWPATVTLPSRLTLATSSSLEVNFAQRVTSSEWPSLYHARTTSCDTSFGFSTDVAGSTSRRFRLASLSEWAGAPAAIHSARTRKSSPLGS